MEFKNKLLDINFNLTGDICREYINREFVNKDYINKEYIDGYIKILNEEINKYVNLPKGIRRRDLHLYSDDLTDHPPANARRRYKRALERINDHNRKLNGPLLKYNEEDKVKMGKTLKLYFMTVEIELLNIRTKISKYRERINILQEIKKEIY